MPLNPAPIGCRVNLKTHKNCRC
uniref:Uncharacterized protein n=1 Tax=Arundo donax TaxID=35708 RepID=A0A0A9FVA4_ARUDO